MDRRPSATFVTKADGGLSLGNLLSDLGITTGECPASGLTFA